MLSAYLAGCVTGIIAALAAVCLPRVSRKAQTLIDGLAQASQDIRDHPPTAATRAIADAAGAQAAADVHAGKVRESINALTALDANTAARIANTEALELLVKQTDG